MKPNQVSLQKHNGIAIKFIDDNPLNLQNCLINIKINFAKEKNKSDCSKQYSSFDFTYVFFGLKNFNKLHACKVKIANHYQF